LRRALRRAEGKYFRREKFTALCSATQQAAEKVEISGESGEEHRSAAKADVELIDLSARVNSCPFKTDFSTIFSAACQAAF
jgi:hypothetical protein